MSRFFLIAQLLLFETVISTTITTKYGKIQGSLSTSYNGRDYLEFFGIPYARPPVGNLRFEEPKKPKRWNGTLLADKITSCLQTRNNATSGNEDCLYLNIFVPVIDNLNETKKLDVIIHIHGGAFMFGSGYTYSRPKYLMDRDVILVTLNHRVGVFGFLSTEDENLPGNLGMKDITLALKWIKSNIASFGGNPKSITITGFSSGGAAVHFLYLSPLTKNLFQRGISTSGNALNNRVIMVNGLKKARILGEAVGCKQKSTRHLVNCLKKSDAEKLVKATDIFKVWLMNPLSPLGVVVDKWSDKPFLPVHPYKLLKEGKVQDRPWLISSVINEGLNPSAAFMNKPEYLPELEENWLEYAPAILHYIDTIPDSKKDEVSRKIKEAYLGDQKIGPETFMKLVQLIGDRLYITGLEFSARLQANVTRSKVYSYQFNYTGEVVPSLAYLGSKNTTKYGVSHGDDMAFVFSFSIGKDLPTMSKNDEKIKDFMLDIWTSFARTGKPGIADWKPVNKKLNKGFNYYYIGEKNEMRTVKEMGKSSFWLSLPFEENQNLFKQEVFVNKNGN